MDTVQTNIEQGVWVRLSSSYMLETQKKIYFPAKINYNRENLYSKEKFKQNPIRRRESLGTHS
jgi:hypothetical protein